MLAGGVRMLGCAEVCAGRPADLLVANPRHATLDRHLPQRMTPQTWYGKRQRDLKYHCRRSPVFLEGRLRDAAFLVSQPLLPARRKAGPRPPPGPSAPDCHRRPMAD